MEFEFLRNNFVLFSALGAGQYFPANVIGCVVNAVRNLHLRTQVLILLLYLIKPSPTARKNLLFGEREVILSQCLVVGKTRCLRGEEFAPLLRWLPFVGCFFCRVFFFLSSFFF